MIGWSYLSCPGGRIASSCECIGTVGVREGVERSSQWPTKLDRDSVPVWGRDD